MGAGRDCDLGNIFSFFAIFDNPLRSPITSRASGIIQLIIVYFLLPLPVHWEFHSGLRLWSPSTSTLLSIWCGQQVSTVPLQWRHNKRDGVSNHWRLYCLLNHLYRRRLKKTSKLHVAGLCEGNPPVIGGFPSQRASNAENIIVRRAGLLWSQRDFEWRWSVRLFKCLTVLEFSFILFDLCLLITFFNFIMNYVPIVTFWIFTYHKIWILSIMFCFIWSYWIIYFLACL